MTNKAKKGKKKNTNATTKKAKEKIKEEKLEDKKQKTIQNIKENYKLMEDGIVNQLFYQAPHSVTIGTHREKIWSDMFTDIVPRKFVIEQSVFIIDSFGNVSNEVDLAIFDETYTPYIFKFGQLKYIPVEAVAVVIECKSTSLKMENLTNWTKSIKELKTSSKSFVRTYNNIACGDDKTESTQKATRPLRILSYLKTDKYKEEMAELFDIVIRASKDEKLSIQWDKKKKSLYDWYESLNHAEDEKKNINKGEEVIKKHNLGEYLVNHKNVKLSLMTFNFQLNQVLMLINNPMFFPHLAYAEMFDKNGELEEDTHE